MRAIRSGKASPARTWEVVPDGKGGFMRRQISGVQTPALDAGVVADETVRARQRLGLSQDTFAALLGVSSGTLRGWEQGRRQPTRAARVLLRVATQHPEVVLQAAKTAA
jgi:putative transcriptional regulator